MWLHGLGSAISGCSQSFRAGCLALLKMFATLCSASRWGMRASKNVCTPSSGVPRCFLHHQSHRAMHHSTQLCSNAAFAQLAMRESLQSSSAYAVAMMVSREMPKLSSQYVGVTCDSTWVNHQLRSPIPCEGLTAMPSRNQSFSKAVGSVIFSDFAL